MFQVQAMSPKSARYWYVRRNDIDMEPEYQRAGGVWLEKDQRFLIDSILNDYDIPKLYLADFSTLRSSLNEEKKNYAVIDGKQRLEAIFAFFNNELALDKRFILDNDPGLELSGLLYKDLQRQHPEIASKVEEYPLPIMHVVTDELDRINELFVRLNKGATLTGPEKRNAMIGPVPKILRRIAKHPFFEKHTRYAARRGQHLNLAAKMLLFELNSSPSVDTKKKQLDEVVINFEDFSKDQLSNAEAEVFSTLERLTDVFGVKDDLLRSQGLIPVYYWLARQADKRFLARMRTQISKYLESLKELKDEDNASIPSREAEFIRAQRSTNDAWSHRIRVDILRDVITN